MSNMLNLIGKYMGRQLESETTEYKKYKMTFKIDDKDLNFKVFTPWTKKDGTEKSGLNPMNLEEGKWYKLGYNTFEGVNQESGKTFTSKTLVSIFEATEPTEKQLTNNAQQQPKTSPVTQSRGGIVLPTDEEVNSILVQYKEKVKPEVKSENHFIGTLIRSFNQNNDSIDRLVKIYNEKVK